MYRLSKVSLYRWEDEQWTVSDFEAYWSENRTAYATACIEIPVSKGNHSVYIECEGFQPVKALTAPNDGKMSGLVAYNPARDGWSAYPRQGCTISNYRATDKKVFGHPELEINNCKFTSNQVVERDFFCSFHLECTTDSAIFVLQAPPLEKLDTYNYIVSYGDYSEKELEFGAISISIDEVNTDASGATPKGIRRLTTARRIAISRPSEGQPMSAQTPGLSIASTAAASSLRTNIQDEVGPGRPTAHQINDRSQNPAPPTTSSYVRSTGSRSWLGKSSRDRG